MNASAVEDKNPPEDGLPCDRCAVEGWRSDCPRCKGWKRCPSCFGFGAVPLDDLEESP